MLATTPIRIRVILQFWTTIISTVLFYYICTKLNTTSIYHVAIHDIETNFESNTNTYSVVKLYVVSRGTITDWLTIV